MTIRRGSGLRPAYPCLLGSCTFGCSGIQSALDPRGREARLLHELSQVLFIGAGVVFVLVAGFLAAALLARRSEREGPAPGRGEGPLSARRKLRAVVLGGVGTALVLVALLLYEFSLTRSLVAHAAEGLPVRVVAHQWWWEVTYLDEEGQVRARTANELHVPLGRPVSVQLESRDVIHSFWVPNLQGKVDAIPGRTNLVTFQADVAGTYRGQCAEFCGLQHANMAFYVIAEPSERFEAWLEHQAAPAAAPEGPQAQEGQQVFLSSSCGLCHSVRGTAAMAGVAPDLTHVASRQSLASGTFENTRGNLGAWILDPQHVKPGTRMPATHLEGDRVHALLSYLESLK